jgi:hypothetical protein
LQIQPLALQIQPLALQTRFCSLLVHISSKEATELVRKGQKFTCGSKLKVFTVLGYCTAISHAFNSTHR